MPLNLCSEECCAQEDDVNNFCRFFLSRGTKNFVGEPFCVSQKFWCQKLLSKIFVPQYRKTSLGNVSVFHKLSGIGKFFELDGGR